MIHSAEHCCDRERRNRTVYHGRGRARLLAPPGQKLGLTTIVEFEVARETQNGTGPSFPPPTPP